MFEDIQPAPADAILGLTEAFRADSNPKKVNLGVGVYQDSDGKTPILTTVMKAEQRLLADEQTKSYLPISGSPEYGQLVRGLLFGTDDPDVNSGAAITCHTPGGTGALRVGADFLRKFYPNSTVWLSDPTWANHSGIFPAAGFALNNYPYYNPETHGLNFKAMTAQLMKIPAKDIVLLHACCHNPTGVDIPDDAWREIAEIANERGWIPFLDFAYQGFRQGINEDAVALKILSAAGVEYLVASSFSKNFGLYRERTGALTLVLTDRDKAEAAFSHLKKSVRTNYSNPPAHGALIVSAILSDPALRSEWEAEVGVMRNRIADMRRLFVEKMRQCCPDQNFDFIEKQNGMFSFSGLSPAQVKYLRDKKSIYIVGSGRINTAGIRENNINYLCESLKQAIEKA